MSDTHSTTQVQRSKPGKLHPDSPRFAHAAGFSVKKMCGQVHGLGPWSDPDAKLANSLGQRDDLHAGRRPRESFALPNSYR
jgi:hypothetical protein